MQVDKKSSGMIKFQRPFRGMAAGFLSFRWIFIALHSVDTDSLGH